MKSEGWLKDKYVKNWFELIGNKRTIENYTSEFPRFLQYAKTTPTQMVESRLDDLASKDITKRRNWENQVIKYMHSMEKEGLRSSTIKGYLRTVRSFFSKSGVKLLFSRNELKPEPTPEEKKPKLWCPTNEEVRVIYRYCKTPRDRSLLLTLYQSGYSPVDVASMQIQDFDFYDQNGKWKIKEDEHLYYYRMREKTNQWQCTCISNECLGDIKMMLAERGFPQKGYLIVSFRDKPLGVRGINLAMKSIVKRGYSEKASKWKTKNLRDSYESALLSASLDSKVKDLMFGHQPQGAKRHYGNPQVWEKPITIAYTEKVFKWLQINGFTQRTTLTKLEERTTYLEERLEQQDIIIEHYKNTVEQQQKTLREILTKLGLIKPKAKQP